MDEYINKCIERNPEWLTVQQTHGQFTEGQRALISQCAVEAKKDADMVPVLLGTVGFGTAFTIVLCLIVHYLS